MALREKLEVIVDANVGGFVSGMDRAASAADKGLGKTDDRLQVMAGRFTTWGAAAAGAGAVAAVGLGKLAMMAADAERQQLKLTNSIANSSQKYSANGAALREQASSLQKVTAAEDDAIVGAQAMLVQFGLTEDQVKSMTPLVVDLSRKMGIDLDAAAKAVGRSATGSTTALKRMGIDVEALGEGSTSAEQTISALSKAVGGFAEAEGQTFAGQLEIIKNRLGELGEGLGGGVLDVVKPFVNLGTALDDVEPKITNTAGRLATYATLGVTVAGGLSFATGQALKMRDSFTSVTQVGDQSVRSLNGMGKAALAVGGALAALAAIEVADTLRASIVDQAGQAEDALENFAIAANGTSEEVLTAFSRLAGAQPDNFFGELIEGFGKNLSVLPELTSETIEDIQRAFESLDLKGQKSVIDALEGYGSGLERGSQAAKDNAELIDNLSGRYKQNGEAAAAAAAANGDAASQFDEATGSLEEQTSATQGAADAWDRYATSIKAATDPFYAAIDAGTSLDESLRKVVEAQAAFNTAPTAENAQALAAAQRDAAQSGFDFQTALIQLRSEVTDGTTSYEQASARLDSLAQQFPALSGVVDQSRADFFNLANQIKDTPDNVKTNVSTDAPVAREAFVNLKYAAEDVEGTYSMTVQLVGAGIVQSTLNNIATSARNAAANIQATINLGREPVIGGKADGGIMTSFAIGGTRLPDNAMIQPATPGLIQWAEPETMGEAFIPLAPSKRKRSKDIWWETGRRLGVIGMAAGGFTADEPWGQYAEAMENAWQATFDAAPLKQQISLALKARDGYAKFSDEWVRFNRLLQDTKGQLAAQNADIAENQFEFNYERSTPENQLALATGRLKGLTKFSDEWVRWTEEIERIRADMAESLTPRAVASGGRSRGGTGGAPFYLTVNVNAEGLVTDPMEVGRQVVGAIKSYEQANGTTWRS